MTAAMAVVEETGLAASWSADDAGRVLYDTTGDQQRREGVQLFTQRSSRPCREMTRLHAATTTARSAAGLSPVLYQNRIIGAVYAYEITTPPRARCWRAPVQPAAAVSAMIRRGGAHA